MLAEPDDTAPQSRVRSLRELLDLVAGRTNLPDAPQEDFGLAEALPFPFLGLVGQFEMKLALLLATINPLIGGVLLIGPRGTGKTTAVRSLSDLLPLVEHSMCFYGCTAQDVEAGGMDAVCPDCARKYGEGLPLTRKEPGRLIELPLNARLDDVVGGLDDRAIVHERMRLKRGILALADQNILYSDEVNLLGNDIVDAILDAAALGSYTVRRGAASASYRARFTLIGSMNPEEGNLRSQIMDRFGLRVIVRGLAEPGERLLAYQRVRSYRSNPRRFVTAFSNETELARAEIQAARDLLPSVEIPNPVAEVAIHLIRSMEIDSLRAEITLLEAARAFAASDGRTRVGLTDLRTVAPMALRLRRSPFMHQYFKDRQQEEQAMLASIQQHWPESNS